MRHDLERGQAGALVHGQDAGATDLGRLWRDRLWGHGRAATSDSRTAWSRAATASSSVPEIVQPAAFS